MKNGRKFLNIMGLKIKIVITYILIYLLAFSSITFIPQFVSTLARYLFMVLCTYYIFYIKGKIKQVCKKVLKQRYLLEY